MQRQNTRIAKNMPHNHYFEMNRYIRWKYFFVNPVMELFSLDFVN